VNIEDNDKAKIGTIMCLGKPLQASHRFAEIWWFTEDEQIDSATGGAAHPPDELPVLLPAIDSDRMTSYPEATG
jgi:hypothetical protein